MRKGFLPHDHLIICLLVVRNLAFFYTFLDEVRELVEVKEPVTVALSILLLIDEIMGLYLLVFYLLHSAVELPDIVWKELSVSEDLE